MSLRVQVLSPEGVELGRIGIEFAGDPWDREEVFRSLAERFRADGTGTLLDLADPRDVWDAPTDVDWVAYVAPLVGIPPPPPSAVPPGSGRHEWRPSRAKRWALVHAGTPAYLAVWDPAGGEIAWSDRHEDAILFTRKQADEARDALLDRGIETTMERGDLMSLERRFRIASGPFEGVTYWLEFHHPPTGMYRFTTYEPRALALSREEAEGIMEDLRRRGETRLSIEYLE